MKKKILFIHSNLGGGGAEDALIKILTHIDYNLFDVTLFLLYRTGAFIDRVPPQVHFMTEEYGGNFTGRIGMMATRLGLRDLYMRKCMRRVFRKMHFDTIASFMESAPAKCHSYILDKADKNVTWVHCDLYNFHHSKQYFLDFDKEKKFYTQMDDIIFVSEEAKKMFAKRFGLDKGRVVYNIIDKDYVLSRSKEKKPIAPHTRFVFVSVGSIKSIKRIDRVIEVAAILKKQNIDCEFWILGIGNLSEQMQAYSETLGVDDRVRFYGFQANPYPYVNAADALIVTSDSEGFSLVVADAMCLGKAIVSTKVSGVRELLDEGKYGILSDFSSADLADKARSLIDDRILLLKYQTLAKERAEAIFNVAEVITRIQTIL